MKCPNCEEEVESSAVFCGNCGHMLNPETLTSFQIAAPDAVADTPGPAQLTLPDVAAQARTPIAPVAHAAQPVPAYAIDKTPVSKENKLLTLAVFLAILSLPGAMIPLLGLIFGVAAIVLAVKHHHLGAGRMVVATALGSIGVLLSLAAFVYNVGHRTMQTGLAPTSVAEASTVVPGSASYDALHTIKH